MCWFEARTCFITAQRDGRRCRESRPTDVRDEGFFRGIVEVLAQGMETLAAHRSLFCLRGTLCPWPRPRPLWPRPAPPPAPPPPSQRLLCSPLTQFRGGEFKFLRGPRLNACAARMIASKFKQETPQPELAAHYKVCLLCFPLALLKGHGNLPHIEGHAGRAVSASSAWVRFPALPGLCPAKAKSAVLH